MSTTDTRGESLYELGEALSRAFEENERELAENGGELTDAMAERILAAEGAFEVKCERVALFIKGLRLDKIAPCKAEEERLAKRRKAYERKADWLQDVVLREALSRQQRRSVERPLASVRIQDNPPAVSATVPLEFLDPEWVRRSEPTLSLDKEALQAARRAGRELPPEIVFTVGSSVRIT